MALGSGMASQIGFGEEASYGATATPTRFFPFVSDGLTGDRARIKSEGIITGQRLLRSSQHNGGPISAGGSAGFELADRGMGFLFKHMIGGTPVTTGPVSGKYTHVITPGDLNDLSFTAQVGKPQTDGTVIPFTYPGSKVASWEVAVVTDSVATCNLDIVSRTENANVRVVADGVSTISSTTFTSATAAFTDADLGKNIAATGIPAGTWIKKRVSATEIVLSAAATATATGLSTTIGTALATASYPSGAHPLKYNHASLLIAGTEVEVTGCTVSGDNMLNSDRRMLGNQFRREPVEAGLRAYGGTIDAEFDSMALYNLFASGTEASFSLGLAYEGNSITIAGNILVNGQTPSGSGRDILTQSIPFDFVGPTTDASAFTVTLVNGDATI